MRSRIGSSLAVALLGGFVGTLTAHGQVVERDTKLTGPRGRTIERSIRTERGPGYVDRQVEIKRPGETLIRDTRIQQPGGFMPRAGYRPGPPGYGRPPILERDVIVERAPILAPFVAPFLSFSFGAPAPPPPPPVVYVPEPVFVPEPVYVAAPPIVTQVPLVVPQPVYPQPAPSVVATEPPLSPQVADAMGRLSSFHHQSRRDGALTLGQLGDPRAVAPLMERVQHDLDREVRVAAAWALGELADPRAALVLERAALYDKRQEVRDAANTAYRKLPRPGQQPTSTAREPAPVVISQPAATASGRPTVIQPSPEPVMIDPGPVPASSNEMPPPPPTPEPALELPR